MLERDEYRCMLRLPGCKGVADEVDHVVPRELGGALYDEDNCRSVCTPCHRRRSNTMRQRTRRRRPSQEWPMAKVPDGQPGGLSDMGGNPASWEGIA